MRQVIALGVESSAEYVTVETFVGPGDMLVMFTDGITEARNVDGEEFSDERVSTLLGTLASVGPEETADRVMDAVATWAPGSPADDQTIMVVRIDNGTAD